MCNVLAQYLDADADGRADDPRVADEMVRPSTFRLKSPEKSTIHLLQNQGVQSSDLLMAPLLVEEGTKDECLILKDRACCGTLVERFARRRR